MLFLYGASGLLVRLAVRIVGRQKKKKKKKWGGGRKRGGGREFQKRKHATRRWIEVGKFCFDPCRK